MLIVGPLMKKIRLQDLDQGGIDELVNSLEECQADIDQVNQLLPIYDSCEKGILKNRYRKSISKILEEIKSKDGYLVFLQMHKIEAFNNENQEVIPEFLEVINFINSNIASALPWEVKSLILYSDDFENRFAIDPLKDSKLFVHDPKDYKYVLANDPMHQAIINIMSSPTGNLRTFEIYNLYLQMLLIKELKLNFNVFSNNGSIDFPKVDNTEDFCNEVEKLFIKYYQKIKEGLDPEYFKGPKYNNEWIELVKGSNNFRTKMINLKENNINILRKFNSEELDDLVLDIRNFLNSYEDLNELVWPKVKQINSKEGGAGLLKRINKNGGMKEVGDHYSKRIKEIIEDENFLKLKDIKVFKDIGTNKESWSEKALFEKSGP